MGLELGVIGTTLFTMGVLMALVTTLMATPMLALISPLYHRGMTAAPGSEEGRRRRRGAAYPGRRLAAQGRGKAVRFSAGSRMAITLKAGIGRRNPLSVSSPTGSTSIFVLDLRVEFLGDQHLAGRRLVGEPRREVGHRADRRIVGAPLEPDLAARRVAERDARAQYEGARTRASATSVSTSPSPLGAHTPAEPLAVARRGPRGGR